VVPRSKAYFETSGIYSTDSPADMPQYVLEISVDLSKNGNTASLLSLDLRTKLGYIPGWTKLVEQTIINTLPVCTYRSRNSTCILNYGFLKSGSGGRPECAYRPGIGPQPFYNLSTLAPDDSRARAGPLDTSLGL